MTADAGRGPQAEARLVPDPASSPTSAVHLDRRAFDVARRAVVRVEAARPVSGQSNEGGRSTQTGFGFVVDENGIVLTGKRLVAGATSVAVILSDGRTLPVTTVVIDPLNDLAVLQVKEGRLRAVPLGSSANLKVGDPLITLAGPVTGEVIGTVRATGAATGGDLVSDARPTGQPRAGLPLLNKRGEAVGIVTHTSEASSGGAALDFAVPIDRAKRVLRDLRPAAPGAARAASSDTPSER